MSTYKILNPTPPSPPSSSFISTDHSFAFMANTCAFALLCCPPRPHYPRVDPAGIPILFQGYALCRIYFIFPLPSSVNLLHLLVTFPSPVWSLLFQSLLFADLWPSSVSSGFKGPAGPWHCLSLASHGIASRFVSSPLPKASCTHFLNTPCTVKLLSLLLPFSHPGEPLKWQVSVYLVYILT